jgi:hypothetical protein
MGRGFFFFLFFSAIFFLAFFWGRFVAIREKRGRKKTLSVLKGTFVKKKEKKKKKKEK